MKAEIQRSRQDESVNLAHFPFEVSREALLQCNEEMIIFSIRNNVVASSPECFGHRFEIIRQHNSKQPALLNSCVLYPRNHEILRRQPKVTEACTFIHLRAKLSVRFCWLLELIGRTKSWHFVHLHVSCMRQLSTTACSMGVSLPL